MDPETHPAGSLLMDDFGSTKTTPLEKDKVAASDFYRIIEQNTLTTSTVSNEDVKDGGTSYSARDSFDTVVEMYKAKKLNTIHLAKKVFSVDYSQKNVYQYRTR